MKAKILEFIRKIFFPMEIIALGLISLRFFLAENYELTTGIGSILLAALYFTSAYFTSSEGISRFATLFRKVLGVALSVSVVGIYFTFLHLPGAKAMLTIGLVSVIISLILLLVEILRKSETANVVRFSVIRGLVIAIASALILYFTDYGS